MKQVQIFMDEEDYQHINTIKTKNKHTWLECLRCYADTYKEE